MGASASTVKAGAIIWLIFTQIIAFAMGGYLAGRLRTKWVDIHTDEVYFRDTAHGLLVWAVGIVLMAAFLASAAAMFAGRAAQRPEPAPASDSSVLNPNEYLIDTMFRSTGTMTDLMQQQCGPRPTGYLPTHSRKAACLRLITLILPA
jgi:hypothetical protein